MSNIHRLTDKLVRCAEKGAGCRLSTDDIKVLTAAGVLRTLMETRAREIELCLMESDTGSETSGSRERKIVRIGGSAGTTPAQNESAERQLARQTFGTQKR